MDAEQTEELRREFMKYDVNWDGQLSKEEI